MARKRRDTLYRVEVWPDPEESPRGTGDVWVADGQLGRVEPTWADRGWIALATWAARWGRSVHRPRTAHQCERYTYTVAWDPKKKSFLATVAEFPTMSSRSQDQVRALMDLLTQVRDHVDEIEDEFGVGSSRIPDPPGGPVDPESLVRQKRGVIDIWSREPVGGDS